jgi:hypothetical protein
MKFSHVKGLKFGEAATGFSNTYGGDESPSKDKI